MHRDLYGEKVAAASQYGGEREYWLNKLSGEPEKTGFLPDFTSPGFTEITMDTISFKLPPALSERLMYISNNSDSRLHMLLAAGLNLLLYKYTGHTDIIIGTPIDKQETEGDFINTILALRNRLAGTMTIKALLFQVRQTIQEAIENQNYPLETIPFELNIPVPEEGNYPLFDIAVILENIQDKRYLSHIKLNMIFSFLQANEYIEGEVEYNSQLYRKETIESIVDHFTCLMREAFKNLNAKIVGIDILTGRQREYLLFELNDTGVEYPGAGTILEWVEEQVEKTPGNIAVEEAETNQFISYEELNRHAGRLASLLRNKGVKRGTLAAVMGERRLDIMIGILAILKSGGVLLPLDGQNPGLRIKFILEDSKAYIFLSQKHLIPQLQNISREFYPGNIIAVDDEDIYKGKAAQFSIDNQPTDTDLAYVIYTSGTTGRPKGVMIEHKSLLNYINWAVEKYVKNGPANFPLYTSIAFDLTITSIFTPLVTGNAVIVYSGWGKGNLIERIIDDNKVDIMKLTPSHLSLIREKKIEKSISRIKRFIVGGELLEYQLAWDISNNVNGVIEIYNEYGPTEATVGCMIYPFNPQALDNGASVPIGVPIDNTQIYLLDNHLKPMPVGAAAEIYVSGTGVARGYLNRPELTDDRFKIINRSGETSPLRAKSQEPRAKLYKTGDLARWLANGNIEFLGRSDQQVKIRGFRIELGEIENQLINHSKIKDAVVIIKETVNCGAYDYKEDKSLCAYFVSNTQLKTSELREYLAGKLPGYMVPMFFIKLDAVPLTTNGKVDRAALPKPEMKTEKEFIAPRDEIEERVAEIWAGVLGAKKEILGIDANFFEIGGHSLKATVLEAKIHKELNVKVPLLKIFEKPTIKGQAEYIREEAAEKAFVSIEKAEKKDYYVLSPAQNRLFMLQQMDPESTAYNVVIVVELYGEAEKGKLEETFKNLIVRHESLRTSFEMINGKSVQRIHEPSQLKFKMEFPGSRKIEDKGQSIEAGTQEKDEIIKRFIKAFDLSQAPLIRVASVKPEPLKHLMMVDMHHIITDGVSQGILIEDFLSLYSGLKLPVLRLQYKDYSEWQQSFQRSDTLEQQEEYWLSELKGEIPVLKLPTDYRRPRVQSFAGGTLDFELDEESTKVLNESALAEGATLFMGLLAIFNIFLSKISSQEDIVVGTPVAGRKHNDLQQIIGMFVNILTLRNYPAGEKTFEQFLNELKERTLKAFENQDYQFENLVEKVAIHRDMSRNPLFDVIFVLQNMYAPIGAVSEKETKEMKIKPYACEAGTSKFDLSLSATERDGKLYFSFEFCTKLYRRETIVRFIEYFKNVIFSIIRDRGKKIWEIEILTEDEKKEILIGFNDTKVGYPGDMPIHHLFGEQLEKAPDRIAVVGRRQLAVGKGEAPPAERKEKNGETGCKAVQLTYKELNRKANQLTRKLRKRGVKRDTIVGIMVERSLAVLTGLLGILKAGGGYLPIDLAYPKERKAYMLKESNAQVLLTQVQYKDQIDGAVEVLEIENHEIYNGNGDNLKVVDNGGNLAYVIYTSGSTGRPKGVMVNHRNVVRLVKNTNYVGFKETDRILQTGALEFDASTFEIWGVLLNGLTLYIVDIDSILNPGKLGRLICRNEISTVWLTSPLFNQLASEDIKIFEGLRNLLVGGDVLSPVHINKVRNRYPDLKIINGYGPTENTTFSTTFLIDREYKTSIPIGKPIANSTVYIMDKNGKVQPIGIVGELWVGGDGVSRGYLNNPELTEEKFKIAIISHSSLVIRSTIKPNDQYPMIDDHSSKLFPITPLPHYPIYHTGDLARWLPDGNIEFLGRIDNQVKIRGFRVELGEIENRLIKKHKHIKEAVVISKKVESSDKLLCAYIVCEAVGINAEFNMELKESLSHVFPDYMIPSFFIPLDKIPLTPNGKLDLEALPEPGINADEEYIAPGNKIEESLAKIWAEVLGVEKNILSINSDFFEMGGHSLKATMLEAKIHKELNVKVPLLKMFEKPTIKGQAEYIKEEAAERTFVSIENAEEKYYYVLSPAQNRLFILQQMNLESTAYNITVIVELKGKTGKGKLEEVFKNLIERHESLRTSIEIIDEKPVQRVHRLSKLKFAVEFYDAGNTGDGRQGLDEVIKCFIKAFDLSQAPLIRVGLIKLEGLEHILMVDMHHIVSDAVSHQILVRDFMSLHEGKELPSLRLQYKDFSEWQNSEKQSEAKKRQEEYWFNRFKGEIPVLDIPTDFIDVVPREFDGEQLKFEIQNPLIDKTRNILSETGATLFMMLSAVYTTLLSIYTGQEDIVVGSPIAGRRHENLQDILGMFVNMLPMRNYPRPEKTFREFLNQVKTNSTRAFENQDTQFDELVDMLGLTRDLNRKPLVETVFTLQNASGLPGNETGDVPTTTLQFNFLQNAPFSTKYDLILDASETEDSIIMWFSYSTRLFKRLTIKKIKNNYIDILEQVVENMDIKLKDITISYDLTPARSSGIKEEQGDFGF